MKKILFSALMAAMAFAFTDASAQAPKVLKPYEVKRHDFAKENQKFEADMKSFHQLMHQGVDYEKIPEELQYLLDCGGEDDPYVTVSDYCDGWYNAGGPSEVTASSHLAQQGKYTYKGECAHDFTMRTPWCEGVDGNGIGEWLLYKFDTNFQRVTTVYIANGFVLNNATYQNNARAKKIRLDYNGKPYAILELEDVCGIQTFDVGTLGADPELKKPFSLKFTILEAYPGTKYQDLCISEIWFSGLDVLCFPAGTLVTLANGSKKGIENIQPGDEIICFVGNSISSQKVDEVAKATHHKFVKYTLENGSNVTCTPDHPIMTPTKGWISSDPEKTSNAYKGYAQCSKAQVGDVVVSSAGFSKIVSIEEINSTLTSYTIVKAGDARSFFANGIEVGVEKLK